MFCHHLSTRRSVGAVATLLTLLVVTPAAHAQKTAPPRLTHVFPMGAKAGTTLEITVTGQNLTDVQGLHFDVAGVRTEPLGADEVKPQPTGKKKKGKGMQGGKLKAQRFKVTLPPDTLPGSHDLRVVTKGGISNARAFVVGDRPEVNEQEPNDDTDKPQRIALNTVVNGIIQTPTDVDYYLFTGKKGQRVICSCLTSSIDSRLPVALEVFDKNGVSFGTGRNYRDNDALLDVTLPADGEYLIRVFGFTYSLGGPDYFYRLTVTTAPWIDAVQPSAIEPGKEVEVTVYGRNLPGGERDSANVMDGQVIEKLRMVVKAPSGPATTRLDYLGHVPPLGTALDGFTLRVKNASGVSNPYLLTIAHAPVVVEQGDNDTKARAQSVPMPCEISGRVEKRGDEDWYTFSAKKGEVVAVEAFGERLGSPVDLFFQVVSARGSVVTEQDDTPETMTFSFSARSEDPQRFRFVAPDDGSYFLKVSSRAASADAGPRHQYLVRIGADRPDFQVVAMPASNLTPDAGELGQFGSYAFNVFVWRLGGFTGDVLLTGDKLPPSLTVRPQRLSSGQKQAVLVVSAAADAPPYSGPISVTASAVVNGKKIVRDVRAAGIVWPVPQANILTLTRLDRELVLAVRDRAPYSLAAGKDKIQVQQGEKISLPIKLAKHWPDFKGTVTLTAAGLPPGLTLPPVTLTAGKESAVAVFEAKGGGAVPPGHYTLVLRGQTQPPPKNGQVPKGGPPNYVQVTPPIALTIVPRQLAKLTVNPKQASAQPGKTIEVTVKVARQFDYAGPFTLEAVPQDKANGVSVKPARIEANQDEAKLVIRVAADAKANTSTALTIRATAMFDTVPVVHEAKATVNVTK